MSLDAIVFCDCHTLGKIHKEFPFPQYKPIFGLRDDGIMGLDLPFTEENHPYHDIIQDWMTDACEHPHMQAEGRQIAAWSGVHRFIHTLQAQQSAAFCTLLTEIPDVNAGKTSADQAAQMLTELAQFQQLEDMGTNWYLIDTKSDKILLSYDPDHDGAWAFNGREGYEIGIDPDGFFVRQSILHENCAIGKLPNAQPEVFFRSYRFEQRPRADHQVEFYSAETEERFVSSIPVADFIMTENGFEPRPIQLLHVEERPIKPDHFSYIVQNLTAICKASVATGNPIVWC